MELVEATRTVVADLPPGLSSLAAVLVSLLLQILSVIRLRGLIRHVVVILAVSTGTVLGGIAVAHQVDPGNLWELLLQLAAPPVLVLTLGLCLIGWILASGPSPRPSRTPR